jgi:hypothetical protein
VLRFPGDSMMSCFVAYSYAPDPGARLTSLAFHNRAKEAYQARKAYCNVFRELHRLMFLTPPSHGGGRKALPLDGSPSASEPPSWFAGAALARRAPVAWRGELESGTEE